MGPVLVPFPRSKPLVLPLMEPAEQTSWSGLGNLLSGQPGCLRETVRKAVLKDLGPQRSLFASDRGLGWVEYRKMRVRSQERRPAFSIGRPPVSFCQTASLAREGKLGPQAATLRISAPPRLHNMPKDSKYRTISSNRSREGGSTSTSLYSIPSQSYFETPYLW